MKKICLTIIAAILTAGTYEAGAQGMAVNSTGAAANSSAMLDVSSTTQGVLVPRMTTAQRTAISSPATGLLVYQTDGTPGFMYYNGTAWTAVSGSASTGVTTNAVAYGSGSGGALNITSSEQWDGNTLPSDANGGFLQYTSITIGAGVTLTVPSGTVFLCTGAVNIQGNIVVDTTVTPRASYSAPTLGISMAAPGLVGITSGGIAAPLLAQGAILNPGLAGGCSSYGNSSDVGGGGGGSLVIRAQGAISISGSITANGGNGSTIANTQDGAGGGGGGVIILASETSISNSGIINANGGNGSTPTASPGDGGGGGGGGLVHFLSPANTTGTVNVNGGTPGSNLGTPTAYGWGGGASGGNGGTGGQQATVAPAAGATGNVLTSTVDPTSLFLK